MPQRLAEPPTASKDSFSSSAPGQADAAGDSKKKRSKWDEVGDITQALPDIMALARKPPPLPGLDPAKFKVIKMEAIQIRSLIGKGGETIKDIRLRSAADIKIDHTPQEPQGTVTIIGDVERVENMIKEVLAAKGVPYGAPPPPPVLPPLPPPAQFLHNQQSGLPFGVLPPGKVQGFPQALHQQQVPEITEPDIIVPGDLVNGLIGPGGAGIKDIRMMAGGSAVISILPAMSPGADQIVRVTGEGKDVARQLLLEKIGELKLLSQQGGAFPGSVPMMPNQAGAQFLPAPSQPLGMPSPEMSVLRPKASGIPGSTMLAPPFGPAVSSMSGLPRPPAGPPLGPPVGPPPGPPVGPPPGPPVGPPVRGGQPLSGADLAGLRAALAGRPPSAPSAGCGFPGPGLASIRPGPPQPGQMGMASSGGCTGFGAPGPCGAGCACGPSTGMSGCPCNSGCAGCNSCSGGFGMNGACTPGGCCCGGCCGCNPPNANFCGSACSSSSSYGGSCAPCAPGPCAGSSSCGSSCGMGTYGCSPAGSMHPGSYGTMPATGVGNNFGSNSLGCGGPYGQPGIPGQAGGIPPAPPARPPPAASQPNASQDFSAMLKQAAMNAEAALGVGAPSPPASAFSSTISTTGVPLL